MGDYKKITREEINEVLAKHEKWVRNEAGAVKADLSGTYGKEMINMEKYLFHSIMNSEYIGIVTILDYEIRLNTYLSELVFPSCFKGKKALVDLALKSGLDEYRFVSFDVDDSGKLILNTNSYATVSKEIEKVANCFLQQRSDIVNNSILTDAQKREILI